MIRRLIPEIGTQGIDALKMLATYTSAAFFAYLSRVFWPFPFTPHGVSSALSHARSRFARFWNDRLS
jgi:hypothetical protein